MYGTTDMQQDFREMIVEGIRTGMITAEYGMMLQQESLILNQRNQPACVHYSVPYVGLDDCVKKKYLTKKLLLCR